MNDQPVVWKGEEMDALDFLQKEADRKAKEQREKLRKSRRQLMISLKLGHWNGSGFRVYNRFTNKTVGHIIDEIDWRFIDKQGSEYKLPNGCNKFSVDQAIKYFTSKNFIAVLRKGNN